VRARLSSTRGRTHARLPRCGSARRRLRPLRSRRTPRGRTNTVERSRSQLLYRRALLTLFQVSEVGDLPAAPRRRPRGARAVRMSAGMLCTAILRTGRGRSPPSSIRPSLSPFSFAPPTVPRRPHARREGQATRTSWSRSPQRWRRWWGGRVRARLGAGKFRGRWMQGRTKTPARWRGTPGRCTRKDTWRPRSCCTGGRCSSRPAAPTPSSASATASRTPPAPRPPPPARSAAHALAGRAGAPRKLGLCGQHVLPRAGS